MKKKNMVVRGEGKGNVPALPAEKTNGERHFFFPNPTVFHSLSIRKNSLKKKKFRDHKA